jgi:hypothetical protein
MMKKRSVPTLVLLVVLGVLTRPILAELRIYEKEGPVTLDREFYDEYFTQEEALESVEHMREALFSFVQLSEHVKSAKLVPEEKLQAMGNTSWETQALGFPNWSTTVEGTLRRKHYELKKAEFELAELRLERGDVAQADCDKAKTAFRKAEKELQKFWDEFGIAD